MASNEITSVTNGANLYEPASELRRFKLTWPVAFIGLGVIVAACWTGMIAYGLYNLGELVF